MAASLLSGAKRFGHEIHGQRAIAAVGRFTGVYGDVEKVGGQVQAAIADDQLRSQPRGPVHSCTSLGITTPDSSAWER